MFSNLLSTDRAYYWDETYSLALVKVFHVSMTYNVTKHTDHHPANIPIVKVSMKSSRGSTQSTVQKGVNIR